VVGLVWSLAENQNEGQGGGVMEKMIGESAELVGAE
jgi:hypothetical protein